MALESEILGIKKTIKKEEESLMKKEHQEVKQPLQSLPKMARSAATRLAMLDRERGTLGGSGGNTWRPTPIGGIAGEDLAPKLGGVNVPLEPGLHEPKGKGLE